MAAKQDYHQWWKEAVIYQVRNECLFACVLISLEPNGIYWLIPVVSADVSFLCRFGQHPSAIAMETAGGMSLASHRSLTTSKISVPMFFGPLQVRSCITLYNAFI